MPQTKLIYGVGRIPKASEFQLGEVIVNVDDSKVYSKSKSNVVFEIGTNNTGSSTTSTIAFSTASAFGSGIITAQEGSNTLIISGGSGITVATGSNNDLIISSQGDPDSDWFIDTVGGRLTASLDVYTKGDITGSNLVITGSGGINFDPIGDSTNFESVAVRYRFGEDGDTNSKRIIFSKTPAGTYQSRFQQNNKQYLLFKETSTDIKTIEINEGNSAINQVDFIVYDTNGNYNIFATASGKVGIGTTSPGEKLTVEGNISASGNLFISKSIFIDDGTGAYTDATIEVNGDVLEIKDKGNVRIAMDSDGNTPDRSIQFGTGSANGTPFQPLMIISGSGNVGIGTSTPSRTLDISGSARIKGPFSQLVLANDPNDAFLEMGMSDGNNFFFKRGDDLGKMLFRRVDNTDVMTLDMENERVGVGTNAPGEALTVEGNISASGYIKLKSNSNTTGIAGALLYSSSNEFYLGFS